MNKVKRLGLSALICAMAVLWSTCTVPIQASAASVEISQVNPITGEIQNEEKPTPLIDYGDAAGVPPVSMDDMTNLVEGKAYEVVNLLQVFVKPFAVIIFIASAIMSLLGIFGKSGAVMKGVIGMGIAGFMYAAVLYAPQLVEFFSTWLLN